MRLLAYCVVVGTASLLLAACSPSGSNSTPASPPAAATPAASAPSLTEPATRPEVKLACEDGATTEAGQYMAENNAWGKQGVVGWTQCMGAVPHARGGATAHWTWDWKHEGDNVKAYPEVVFGHKPGYPKSTTTLLPRKLNTLQAIAVDYDVTTEREGAGNLAIDMWLTSTASPTAFAVPPITHEVMIWLESFGPMYQGGELLERVRINGTLYRVHVGEKFGLGWRYVAFAPNSPMQTAAHVDVMPFFTYLKAKGLITTEEFLAAVNLGNEIIAGQGDTWLNRFAVTLN